MTVAEVVGGDGMTEDLAQRYLEHLTDGDLAWVARLASVEAAREITPGALERDPALLLRWVGDRRVADQIVQDDGSVREGLSPFLLFAAVMAKVRDDLRQATAVQEWVGPRQRVFVFDVEPLRGFVEEPNRRYFLIELLASYTRVASGSVRVRGRRGWRRHRVSELNFMQLAGLLDVVPEGERPWVYRRLGDLALFLSGVFPDHVVRYPPFDARGRARLARLWPREDEAVEPDDAIRWLEYVGRKSYETAAPLLAAVPAVSRLLAVVARDISPARRVLNVAADRYLLPQRVQWFPNWSA